jgi:hypothetical protein
MIAAFGSSFHRTDWLFGPEPEIGLQLAPRATENQIRFPSRHDKRLEQFRVNARRGDEVIRNAIGSDVHNLLRWNSVVTFTA